MLHVNPTTVALSYLIAILLIATAWGIVEATTASIVAVLCFNFFFLPPVGTLTIADPQNWVALVAFLVTAIVASQLSGRARQREIDAAGTTARSGASVRAQPGPPAVRGRGVGLRSDRASYCRRHSSCRRSVCYDQRADTVSWARLDGVAGDRDTAS